MRKWLLTPERVEMSEAEDSQTPTSNMTGRVELDADSGPIHVVAGEVDVFAIGADGSLVPVATCVSGEYIFAPDPPCRFAALTRLGGEMRSNDINGEAPIEPFIEKLQACLGEAASPLAGATNSTIGTLLADVVGTVLTDREQRLDNAARKSAFVSQKAHRTSIERAAYSAVTLTEPVEGFGVSPLVGAVQLLGHVQKFPVVVPSPDEITQASDELSLIAHKSGLRYRSVVLEAGWYDLAVTPFLGFLAHQGTTVPVALVRRGRYYTIQSSDDPRPRRIGPAELESLTSSAFEFYTPFDSDRPAKLRDVIRLALVNTTSSWLRTLTMSFGVLLLGLLTPALTSVVIGTFIPQDQTGLLLSTGAALVLAAIGIFLFSLVQNFSISRISQISTRHVQAAFWDRLLALPTEFYRRYDSGELAIRSLAIDRLSTILSVQVVSATLTAIFGVFYVFQMFYFDVMLGFAGLLFLVATVVVLAASLVAFNRQTVVTLQATMESNGLLVQILSGLGKIRIAHAEKRFSAKYLEILRREIVAQSRVTVIVGRLNAWFVFSATAAPAFFYLLVYQSWSGDVPPLTTAAFLAFYSAYTVSFSAIAGLSNLMSSLATVAPMYQLVTPLMEALPETGRDRVDPGKLTGRIELRDVHFRYTEDGPLIFRGLSMMIKPGELVALVGRTGAGKSTVTRMLLAFERPLSGQILFDGKDLAGLDPTLVRGQMGVVMQSGRITRGTVLHNILGDLSQDEDLAWGAAEGAAIADDIRAMPMGMHTLVDPSNISGGQAQRLLIARALVTKPRIVIMDEATSALDNVAQAQVTEALGQLQATRLVIAHRLSTIRSADRIVVLDGGTAVQSGTFDELTAEPGLFVDLVKRQVGSGIAN